MFFENKQKKIEEQIRQYCDSIELCVRGFQDTFTEYCRNPDRARLRSNVNKVHKAESMADDIRRDVESMMYSKALFPESRGDILGLLETMDRVPNRAESATRSLLLERIDIPSSLSDNFVKLVDLNCHCVRAMIEGVHKLFSDFTSAGILVGKVDELESEADRQEAGLIESIFDSDLEGTRKLQLRDLVKRIADISDLAEIVGDRMRIMVVKRRI